jgi:hypothetical protein
MTWTYTQAPETEVRDEVRLLVGDTDDLEPLVQDEEIAYSLVLWPKPSGKPAYLAGAHIADAIAAQFARRADRSVGELSISAKQQRDHYVELADNLRQMFLTNGLGTDAASAQSFAAVPAGVPVLGGGGPTYLGGPTTLNQGGAGNGS